MRSGPEMMWDSDKVFRRVLASLFPFYIGALILIQLKPELFHFSPPAPARADPPRVARILPSPPNGNLPEMKEAPAIQKAAVPLAPASPSLPAGAGSVSGPAPVKRADRGLVGASSPSASRSSGEKTGEEQIKKVGILGLLGEGKGPAGRGFASLKEVPPAGGKGDGRGKTLSTLSESEIETIHHKTVLTEEQRLAQGRRAVIEANLSQPKIIQEGFAVGQQTIQDIVYQNKEKLLVLYNRRLIKNPTAQGNMTLEFIISPRGRVIKCYILSSSLSDPLFEKEVIEEIMAWTFPSIEKGETTVLYPLAFFPAG